jgi:hypothetical protein
MKLIKNLKGLKLGQLLAWRDILPITIDDDGYQWVCITQVDGFRKQTEYPRTQNGMCYITRDKISHRIIIPKDLDSLDYQFMSIIFRVKGRIIETDYTYEKDWEAWLLEDEKDYIEIIKNLMVDRM